MKRLLKTAIVFSTLTSSVCSLAAAPFERTRDFLLTTSLLAESDTSMFIRVRMPTGDMPVESLWNTFLAVVPPVGEISVSCRDRTGSAVLDRLFWFRGNRIAGIRIGLNPSAGESGSDERIRETTVEIRFAPWEIEKPVRDSEAMRAVTCDLVVNPKDVDRWRIREVPSEQKGRRQPFDPGDPMVKLTISKDGICRIIDEIDFSGVDPLTIRVFNLGVELPVYVHGEADGVFDPGDYVEFLCSRYRNADGSDNKYTDTNAYWFSWGETPGLRVSTLDGGVPGSGPATDYIETIPLEENHLYTGGHYYWDSVRARELKSFDIPVDHLTTSLDPGILRMRLVGMTSVKSVAPDHHVIIYWNEHPLYDEYWDGVEECLLELTLPVEWINEGQNQLHIYFPGDTGAGEIDGCFVDWFELEYSRRYAAFQNRLDFSDPLVEVPGRTDFEVSGFDGPNLTLFRTDTNQKIINCSVSPSGDRYTLMFSDQTGGSAQYTATSESGLVQPDRIDIGTPEDLKSTANEADYLIVSHPDFLTELETLTKHLRAKDLRVFTASIEDVFDTFSYGIWDPGAIRDFCACAFHNWSGIPPSYLLLVGDSSWDYKEYLPDSRPVNFLPAYGKTWTDSSIDPFDRAPYDASDLLYGEPMVDDQFVCISGDDNIPDIAVGRIAVQTSEQLRSQIQKIISYETQTRDLCWQKNMLFINGGVGDSEQDMFRDQSETIIERIVDPTGRYWHVSRIYKESDHREWGWYEEDIIRAFNDGRLLVNFLGHAGTWSWEAMLNFDDIDSLENAGKLPMITSMTCNTARFANPVMDCFGEKFTVGTGNQTGAVAFWGGCNFGGYWSDYFMAYYFYEYLLIGRTVIVGNCILKVKIKTLVQYPGYAIIIEPYTLLGNPDLKINLPSDPVINLAGFMDTHLSTVSGGTLQITAFVTDPDGPEHIDRVELLYSGLPTGILLEDDGIHGDMGPGDSVYGVQLTVDVRVLDPFVHLLGILATDIEGNQSKSFPTLVSSE